MKRLAVLWLSLSLFTAAVAVAQEEAPPAPNDQQDIALVAGAVDQGPLTIKIVSDNADVTSATDLPADDKGVRDFAVRVTEFAGVTGFKVEDRILYVAVNADSDINGTFKLLSNCSENNRYEGPAKLVEDETVGPLVKEILIAWTKARHPKLDDYEGLVTLHPQEGVDVDVTLKARPAVTAVGFISRN